MDGIKSEAVIWHHLKKQLSASSAYFLPFEKLPDVFWKYLLRNIFLISILSLKLISETLFLYGIQVQMGFSSLISFAITGGKQIVKSWAQQILLVRNLKIIWSRKNWRKMPINWNFSSIHGWSYSLKPDFFYSYM